MIAVLLFAISRLGKTLSGKDTMTVTASPLDSSSNTAPLVTNDVAPEGVPEPPYDPRILPRGYLEMLMGIVSKVDQAQIPVSRKQLLDILATGLHQQHLDDLFESATQLSAWRSVGEESVDLANNLSLLKPDLAGFEFENAIGNILEDYRTFQLKLFAARDATPTLVVSLFRWRSLCALLENVGALAHVARTRTGKGRAEALKQLVQLGGMYEAKLAELMADEISGAENEEPAAEDSQESSLSSPESP